MADSGPRPLIEARGLCRRFGDQVALQDFDLSLAPGSVLGLLGPNGAGKTTAMRILAGLLAADAGTALVAGHELRASEAGNAAIRASCGLVPEQPGFYERLSAIDNLRFYAGLQGIERAEIDPRVRELLARFGLSARAEDRVGTYSKGMQQRLSLARALLHRPSILFLDEPTAGLDPVATADLHALIGELRQQGCALILSTHVLEEVEALADQVLVLRTRPLYYGPPQAMGSAEPGNRVELAWDGGELPDGFAWPLTVTVKQHKGEVWQLQVESPRQALPQLVQALLSAGARVYRAEIQAPSLRERYLELIR